MNGLLYTKGGRLCVPDCQWTKELLLQQHHDQENHFGISKTRASLARQYFWPNMPSDVNAYIRSCSTCQRYKSSTQVPAGLLHPLPVPLDRFSDISMDFIGPLPKSRGFDTLFVVTDRLTGYTKIEPTMQTATAKDIAELFHCTWYRQFGLPRTIVSDRDKLFLSKFWKELHRLLNVKIKLSTAYHPETDGSTESANKTIIVSLRHYVNKRQTDWAVHLTHVESVFNNSVNTATHQAPNELLYGTTVRLFPNMDVPIDTSNPAVADYLEQIQERISDAIAIAKDNRLIAKTIQTRNANRHRREEPKYLVGDMVMLDSQNLRRRLKKTGKSAKFYPRFIGPFKIIDAHPTTSNYKLQLLPEKEYQSIHPNFHARLLRPFTPNDPAQFPMREPPRPPPIIPEDNQYEVERIVEHRPRRGRRGMEYKVHWLGYPEEDDEWIKEENIDAQLVRDYWAQVDEES